MGTSVDGGITGFRCVWLRFGLNRTTVLLAENARHGRSNPLAHSRALPVFHWTAETDMACVATAVTQTREQANAHHIQRLMVTGNFALLAGFDPHL